MSSVQISRAFLLPQSILFKQVDAFTKMTGLGIEYVAATQWYQDIFNTGEQVKAFLKPIVDEAKELEDKTKADPENAELKKEFDEANAKLQAVLSEQVPVNVVTLKVKTSFSKPSIHEYAILRSLHSLKLINCELLWDNEEEK